MNHRIPRRAVPTLGAVLAASLFAAPTAAVAAPAAPFAAEESTGAGICTVSGGTLNWGVKESFRAYISGNIAHGSWETADGAAYETPEFIFSGATGTIDPSTGEGSVSFAGTIHFTGHDGVLDLSLSNPTVEFDGDGAALLIDAKSNDMEGNLAVDAQQQWAGDIELDAPVAPEEGRIEISTAPVTLTNEGAKAFAGFYEAGVVLDPISLSLDVTGCESTAAAADDADSEADAAGEAPTVTASETRIPWLPIGIGGVALLVIGFTLGMLVGARSRTRAQATSAGRPADAVAEADGSFEQIIGGEK